MSTDTSGKVTAARLRRDAYLYIRQSTLYQVANNTESTARQYDLRGRAVALGWPADRIHVIDIDQGHSGASSADREGFQHLVAEVSLGRAGIILGLECSRLARNNADWHRLLQICAHNDTLILDEDGLYDPTSFNDRLLLGMKGQLSEAELHFLRARLRGGILAKARRGELRLPLPIGLAYDSRGETVLDPDGGVRQAISLLFDTFTATGSAFAVVRAFRQAQLTFPARHRGGPRAGELYFRTLTHDQVLKILHNPCYAGAYCYGRARHITDLDGHHHTLIKPAEDWTVLLPDHHPGYITWPRYQANLQVLAANAAARGDNRTAGPAREGPALLQGLIVCGRCGRRMTVRYHTRADSTIVPDYVCQNDGISNAGRSASTCPAPSSTPPSPTCCWPPSPRWPWRSRSPSPTSSPPKPGTPTPCAPPTSSAPSMQPTRPGAATWQSTPETGWSPTPSKPTGTPACANWPPPTTTTPPPSPPPPSWTTSSAPASGHWPPISPRYGTTRPPRCGNANA